MRAPSPITLALAGTVAAHLIVITGVDVLVVTRPAPPPTEVAPQIELTDVEVTPLAAVPLPPPPPPPPTPPVPPVPIAPPAPTPVHHAVPAHVQPAPIPAHEPAPTEPPTATPSPSPTAGGAPVYHMDNVAPGAVGSPAGAGAGPIGNAAGHGGTGRGSGSGDGGGDGPGHAPVVPISIATIKTRALPKPGFDVLDLGRDYPAEAKQLGIEGSVHVRLIVDAHGKVTSSRLLDYLGHGLDELALRRAAAIEFTPALDADDRPVASVVIWTFAMHLPTS